MKINFIKKQAILLALFGFLFTPSIFGAQNFQSEIDAIRANLACQKDKNTQEYVKCKQKLNKLIVSNKVDYTHEARLKDSLRLINEKNYNAAIYELKALIDENYNRTKCLEFLGDICRKTKKDASKTSNYYKLSLKENPNNISAAYKLAKLYLKEERNILGIEYLKYTVEKTQNPEVLYEIEYILKNAIQPNDRFEANNMYEVLGELYVRLNKKQEAFDALNEAIKLNPSDTYLKYYLGDLYYQTGEARNASVVYDAILNENPDDSSIRISRAKALSKDGDIQSSESEYRFILKDNPSSIQALYGIYKLYENKLPVDKILMQIYKDTPNYTASKSQIIRFAKIMEQMNDSAAANRFIEYAENLDRIEKEKQEAKRKALEEERIKQRIIEERKELAIRKEKDRIRVANELALKKKQEAEALRLKKAEELKLAQQKAKDEKLRKEQLAYEQAKKQKEEKLKKEQLAREQAKKLQQEKLRIQQEKKEQQERILAEKKAYSERLAQEKKINDTKLLEEKKLLQQEKERELMLQKQIEAKKLEEERIKQEQLLAEKKQKEYEDRMISLEKQKSMKKDINAYNKNQALIDNYMKQDPKTAQTYVAIANTYKMMGQPTSAMRNYKEAMKLDPVNSDIYYNMGLTFLELNSPVSAKANLIKAVNLDKNNTKAHNLLAFVNQKMVTSTINDAFSDFEKKEYVTAYDKLDKGIKDFPDNAQLYYYRALVCDAMKRNAAQIIDLQKSIQLDPSYYMSYYQLGKAYEKINDERNALVAYERFLSTEPDEKELVDEIQKKVLNLSEKYY